MLCVVWQGDGFHQNRADWTVPLMWIFVSAGTKQKGLSGRVLASARSQIMRGPIWAGNNTFLVSAFNLNAFGRGLVLCESGEGSPTYSKHARTHLDGEKRAVGLTAHMGLLTQHTLRRLLEPRPQSYFYSCPISSTTSPTFSGAKVNHLTVSAAAEICFFFVPQDRSPIMNIIFVLLKSLGGLIIIIHLPSQVVVSQAVGCSSALSRRHMNFPSLLFTAARKKWCFYARDVTWVSTVAQSLRAPEAHVCD